MLIQSGFLPETVELIEHGIQPRRIPSSPNERAAAKRQLGYSPDSVLLSIFGFVSAYKGHDVAIRALRQLPDPFHLVAVGGPHPESGKDRSMERLLRATCEDGTLQGRVRVTGYLEPVVVERYLTATDICLAPYRDVGLSASGALTWALSSGRPVIASRIPAFTELNESSDCCLLCGPESPYELAWNIERLAADSSMQNRLVNIAARYVAHCGWQNIGAKIAEQYRRLVDRPGATWLPLFGQKRAA